MQDLYHSLKPNRAPQCYMIYRALGLNSAQGRLQEEIWAALVPDVWEAAGAFQEGRSQCQPFWLQTYVLQLFMQHGIFLSGCATVTARKPLTPSGAHPCNRRWFPV
jgi:hypothetical protein